MRYGLKPLTRRVWSERGKKPVLRINPRYEWGYTYGALEVGGESAAEFLHVERVSLEASYAFLEQIARSAPQFHHIVIWDGAGFHQREDGILPSNLSVIRLPAYSPELNPIERLWDVIEDGICNRCWERLKELEEGISAQLKRYWDCADLVRSLVGEGWLALQANTSSPYILLM